MVCGGSATVQPRSRSQQHSPIPLPSVAVVWGLVTGILAALSVGCAFIVIFYEAKQNLFTDDNEKLFEGIVMLVACVPHRGLPLCTLAYTSLHARMRCTG